jgi:hypothetical protein
MINKVASIREIIALFHRDIILAVAGERKIVGVLIACEIKILLGLLCLQPVSMGCGQPNCSMEIAY